MGIYKIKTEVPSSEYDKLYKFIKYSWREDHAFVKSKELLDFQHLDKERNIYHFIVAENQQTGEFDALVGYIPLSQFDRNLAANGDYWGAIWKRRDDVDNSEIKGMGYYVWDELFRLPGFSSHGAISMSGDARMMYKARRLPIDIMKQYYILNNEITDFEIAGNIITHSASIPSGNRCELKWIDINTIKETNINICYRPLKSVDFFKNRYYRHPIYNYKFLGLYNHTSLQAVMAVREMIVGNTKALRIIDVIGELKGNIYESAQTLMHSANYEYIDLLNYGIDTEIIIGMGFSLLNPNKNEPIIPNYFEPFVKQNVIFEISYKAKFPYVAFKGDADQDRPNIL